ncbi:MAG TPA: prepilin-type N-terminal cleavage/methylation domain-containing protein [Candidatus Acidoferrum sp.]|nr:prepilin-type N-terminal cleavage/methylation domain-containing protein [Candidatus Acidoferrum sp.]
MTRKKQFGFSMLETMVSLAVLFVVGSIVMSGMGQLLRTQGSIANRTEMHSSVRSATELLQQEIGQAGRIALSSTGANVTLHSAVVASTAPVSFALDSTGTSASIYPGEWLTFDVGLNREAVQVVSGSGASGTATFTNPHPALAPVSALGAFATGIVPPATTCGGGNCGSSATVLKIYGDINGDGNMVYVEYTCTGTNGTPGSLYRNQMPITQATKPANDNTMILLSNVLPNPNDNSGNPVPCFAYQVQPLGSGTCVTDVAVTLTVQTQNKDPQTQQFQLETKALLNVSPRNVVEVYDTASLVDPTRAQPMPPSVTNLLLP